MALVLESAKHTLKFNFEAGTSRGTLSEKEIWIMRVHDQETPGVFGYGECAPLIGLSEDNLEQIDDCIEIIKGQIRNSTIPKNKQHAFDMAIELVPRNFPALRFAIESALLDLMLGGKKLIFNNDFYHGTKQLAINGLIWMGEKEFMVAQVDDKLNQGYTCLKMKIGAIDFEQECEILEYIRSKAGANELTLRVDANGAFQTAEALKKLKTLSEFDIHSIEQPIMRYQHESMFLLSQKSQVPIALDEELIGVHDISEKARLLDYIQPQYIILKPSLLGGFKSTEEWIELAQNMGVGWWITSALESNIGLNAIAQFTAGYNPVSHQGLGTGQLYENNIHSPLGVKNGFVSYNPSLQWDLSGLHFS